MNPYEFGARWIGMKEKAGPANDPFVAFVNWFAGGAPTDDEAWCGALMSFIAYSLGLERPALPRRARAWLTVGEKRFLGERIYSPEEGVMGAAAIGDIAIFSRGTLLQPGPSVIDAPGHVGIVAPPLSPGLRAFGSDLRVLGGNQADAVSVQLFPINRILGVRRLRPAGH